MRTEKQVVLFKYQVICLVCVSVYIIYTVYVIRDIREWTKI